MKFIFLNLYENLPIININLITSSYFIRKYEEIYIAATAAANKGIHTVYAAALNTKKLFLVRSMRM